MKKLNYGQANWVNMLKRKRLCYSKNILWESKGKGSKENKLWQWHMIKIEGKGCKIWEKESVAITKKKRNVESKRVKCWKNVFR